MKISLNWVKKYTDIILSPEKLKERISVSLTEVEDIKNFGNKYKDIIAVEVKKVENHLESSSLLALEVTDGKKIFSTVVQDCRVKTGDKVAFIKPGLMVPNTGVGVKETKVKGINSNGIIPSGRELGLNYDHTNVYTLDKKIKPGARLSDVLDLKDQILEIKNKALTHRPDTFGLYGIAREIAAIQGTKLGKIDWFDNPKSLKPSGLKDEMPLEVVDESKDLCKRYIAIVIKDVEIKDSPLWIQVELSKMGIHPVNNIVDVSNYLMLLTGQPSHAFDYDVVVKSDPKFNGTAVLKVRRSKKGEKVTTLDGQERDLDNEILVIADSTNPIAVAGVMGGKGTEISKSTKNIIYQVESLDMYSIRRSSMKLGLFTDAVTRFSKGIDPNMCEPVMYKALEMMLDLSGGSLSSKLIDIYPNPVKEKKIRINKDDIRGKTGIEIKDKEIKTILKRLGLGITEKSLKWEVTIPTYRRDLNIPEDINEEVARVFGYDKVVTKLPLRECEPVVDDQYRQNVIRIKRILSSFGAHEIYTYSFVSSDTYKQCNLSVKDCYKLLNAISPELVYMRPLVLPSLLGKVQLNSKSNVDFACFEIDKVDPCNKSRKKLPEEPWHLGFVHTVSYYHSKKYLEEIMESLGVSNFEIVPLSSVVPDELSDWLRYTRGIYDVSKSALIVIKNRYIGILGQFDPSTISLFEIPVQTSGFELNLDDLESYISNIPSYDVISKYPEVIRDYSFITEDNLKYSKIVDAIKSVDPKNVIIKNIECVDIYNGSDKKKKTTMRVIYQSMDKTLEDSDIKSIEEKVISSVKKNASGSLAK